jgi:Zn-dependent alcohol dehydrogenase
LLITAAVLREKAKLFNIEQLELDILRPDEILAHFRSGCLSYRFNYP